MTQNGVTDHIGRSQVAPYVLALAKKGFEIHVLSAEKSGRDGLIKEYQRQFDACGVRWSRVPYRNNPPLMGQAMTQLAMKRAAKRIIARERTSVLHCRSVPPALIAQELKRELGIRYILDFRDFYADGGLAKSRGLKRLVFKRLKEMERDLVRDADRIVCLTSRARAVLATWYLQDQQNAMSRFEVIPCCADFAHFDPARVSPRDQEDARRSAGLSPDDRVMLYLGSLGPDYLLPRMMAAFRQYDSQVSNAKFLFVSNNGKDLVTSEAEKQGVPIEKIAFVSVDRDLLPPYLCLAELSVLFIRADVSKAGCSPTKLAELFACGIPVIANAGVGDLDEILSLSRNGSIALTDLSDHALWQAIRDVRRKREAGDVEIRLNSVDLRLEEGVERYASVYSGLLRRE